MIHHPRFTRRLLDTPHLISPSAGRAVLQFLLPDARMDELPMVLDDDMPMPSPRAYQLVGSCAVVPILGELVHRGGAMDAFSGVTSYQALADMAGEALADPAVGSLLLDLDSPGGEGPGCLDLASWLASMRGDKPIIACINQQACSAAYAIASAADRIIIAEDALAGSIGVVAYHTDLSAAMQQAGIAVEFVYAGARKIDGNPTSALSDPARAELQGMVDAMYARFCATVAENRGMTPEAVAATEAGLFRGRAAIGAGLADACATLEDCVMQLSSRTAPTGARMRASKATISAGPAAPPADPGLPWAEPDAAAPAADAAPAAAAPDPMYPDCPMPSDCQCAKDAAAAPGSSAAGSGAGCPHVKPKAEAPAAPASAAAPVAPAELPAQAEALANACAAAGRPELIAPLLRSRASMETARARIADAAAIHEAARLAAQPNMATLLVEAGVSLETARALIFAASADFSDATRINTARPESTVPGQPPVDVAGIYRTYNRAAGRA